MKKFSSIPEDKQSSTKTNKKVKKSSTAECQTTIKQDSLVVCPNEGFFSKDDNDSRNSNLFDVINQREESCFLHKMGNMNFYPRN